MGGCDASFQSGPRTDEELGQSLVQGGQSYQRDWVWSVQGPPVHPKAVLQF